MNDLQIRYILSVAETHSFTRTAELNHVQQPAVSAQIRQAEDSLGFTIFDRRKSGAILTPAGQELVNWLTETRQSFQSLKDRAISLESRGRKHINIGVLGYNNFDPFSEAVHLTLQQSPGTSIYLEVLGPNELIANAAEGKYSALFCEKDIIVRLPTFRFYIMGEVEWVIVYSRLSPYASKTDLSLSDFANETFIGPGDIKENQTGLLPFHNVLFKNAGVMYPKATPAPNIESTILQIQSGIGVGFCTKAYAEEHKNTLCYMETGVVSSVGLAIPNKAPLPVVELLVKNLKYCSARYAFSSRLK